MDGVGDGHADGIRQPPARPGEPVEEGVGTADGVGTDQCPTSPTAAVWAVGPGRAQWRWCGRRRCWSRRCRAAAARPPAPRPDRGRRTRRGDDGRRSSFLFLGVCEHQHALDVHDHRSAGGRTVRTVQLPTRVRTSARAVRTRGQCVGPGCGKGVDQTESVGSDPPKRTPRAGPRCGDIGEAVPPRGSREHDIRQDLPPGLAPPAACATVPAPPISRCPGRTCGPSRPAAPPRPARPPRGHHPP